jgi:hypothetical protein
VGAQCKWRLRCNPSVYESLRAVLIRDIRAVRVELL